MAKKAVLPPPGPNAPIPDFESPWTPKEPSGADDYPGAPPKNRDPTSLSEGTAAPIDNSYPGAGVPGEPMKQAPAIAPQNRLRRGA
jgi:hypothetical protein